MRWLPLLLLSLATSLTACGDDDPGLLDAGPAIDAAVADAGSPDDVGPPPADSAVATCEDDETSVTFETTDGVPLEADLRPAGVGSPVVILLHQIPPSSTRFDYTVPFQRSLTERGLSVLNVDRRGAGGSGGTARDAYEGPGGALDVSAAVAWLGAHPCGFDLSQLALVGASNGTTSALDYTVAAASDERPDPVALVFLSGGAYTENQNAWDDARATVDLLPILFLWGDADGAANTWATGIQATPADPWVFEVYEGSGAHGTAIPTMHAGSVDTIGAFLEGALE